METEQIKDLIEQGLPGVEARVVGDGSHFEVTAIGEAFDGKSPVARQQLVYGPLNEAITSGQLHAVTIKAYTPEEWEKAQKFQVST